MRKLKPRSALVLVGQDELPLGALVQVQHVRRDQEGGFALHGPRECGLVDRDSQKREPRCRALADRR